MVATFLLTLALPVSFPPQAEPRLDPRIAREAFDQAHRLAAADDGRLWGTSLAFPLLFVDPTSRACAADRADDGGVLVEAEGVWSGRYPDELFVANATTRWIGRSWTLLAWPLPEEPLARGRLLMHESFHNAQPGLGIQGTGPGVCDHLNTYDGRVWMRLEANALARAVASDDEEARDTAAADALLFRARRRALFPGAEEAEEGLERLEGSAEYTGVVLSTPDPALRRKATVDLLEGLARRPSLTRSFMYATGPALGLLLDAHDPFWREGFLAGAGFTELLSPAILFEDLAEGDALARRADERAAAYDLQRIVAEEKEREEERLARARRYRARYVEGPVLILPAGNAQRSFDPSRVEALEEVGVVYGTLWLSDRWGVADAPGGGLVLHSGAVHLPGPSDIEGPELGGDGWTLELAPGWSVEASERQGDYRVVRE